jgi:hypothetical protein
MNQSGSKLVCERHVGTGGPYVNRSACDSGFGRIGKVGGDANEPERHIEKQYLQKYCLSISALSFFDIYRLTISLGAPR